MSGLVPPVWAQLVYLVAAVCFVLALKGLSSPTTARRGNLIGAAGAVLATATVLISGDLDHLLPIGVAIVVGVGIGALGAYRVQMTQMPQLVALFNGVGGGAAAIVALVELNEIATSGGSSTFQLIATAFTIVIGSVSFTGSIVTFLKLQELMTTRPITFAGYPILYGLALLSAIGFGVFLALFPTMVA
ncbi:MAG TPA: NAD(P)(+) transhydrogenase (Re/Si-specific) subunit beta, partial [Microlunatus sp.]|nr:NAD(P)(+) transhydrogenase (Re/Si-specific) subunit beta [Microlunatus sp.]